ncbi:GNAT family N-acetyltransferase [Clostridium sp. CS001]|uniref:GNAT family N-acetyltransferase n=1 Tax=Clostridium sp. CS001 TaxID=2880648 RepID=UPI001CF4264B|nr:GNAT family protein [Clostridium sp. CS001]MCB2291356.1 GNAT family N-acetyltransferase [Clostridium sp. CS001]
MIIKLKKFTCEEIPQLISWIPNKEFLLQWAGPTYTLELLEKQLQNDISLMINEESKSMIFSAKLIGSNETVGHIELLGIDRVNLSAIDCYKKAGFTTEGTLRECRRINGQYWSLMNMSILEEEYRNFK